MTVVRILRLCACAALLCLAVSRSAFAEDGPWPEFSVTDLAGAEVASASLAAEGRWLAVYVTPASEPAVEWLRLFDSPVLGAFAPRLAIVVGETDLAGAAALRERHPALHAARWYVDTPRVDTTGLATNGAAYTALAVSGVPFAWGMDGAEARWKLAGVLPDKAVMTSLLQTWVSQ
jgi:hypothetical protein